MENNEFKAGVLYTAAAYILWGFLPIYWKLVQNVPAGEILAHRIVWSFVFMALLLFFLKKWKPFIRECRQILRDRQRLIGITLASIVISINWLVFIWAVNSDHVVQASLGYYINPLISIILGMAVLKEKLTKWQLVSFLLAAAGVVNLTISFGVFPWVSILLALSFGLYGLLKKTVAISAMFGLAIETMIVMPIALIYLVSRQTVAGTAPEVFTSTTALLVLSGIATAVPLLLFASGAQRIPLSMVGFLQYFAPTLMLFIGVFLYGETFTHAHLVSFTCIWAALAIYTVSRTKWFHHLESRFSRSY
ncbi:EamA family transporter RarD [Sediminibacillus dalangtanensis]|uniref:EamA family transporter RarD n=1 Tax=Sediminibacillus dalangtanensis TaxID=2729421 RepID=A0ABX7VVH8_9BACI|nr:EamA family transporter RarD [Sediminibacillus dalangtanensis]QTN00957.1 EamA family transporter RarD [Sediminibacillus dalangtanensis]